MSNGAHAAFDPHPNLPPFRRKEKKRSCPTQRECQDPSRMGRANRSRCDVGMSTSGVMPLEQPQAAAPGEFGRNLCLFELDDDAAFAPACLLASCCIRVAGAGAGGAGEAYRRGGSVPFVEAGRRCAGRAMGPRRRGGESRAQKHAKRILTPPRVFYACLTCPINCLAAHYYLHVLRGLH